MLHVHPRSTAAQWVSGPLRAVLKLRQDSSNCSSGGVADDEGWAEEAEMGEDRR